MGQLWEQNTTASSETWSDVNFLGSILTSGELQFHFQYFYSTASSHTSHSTWAKAQWLWLAQIQHQSPRSRTLRPITGVLHLAGLPTSVLSWLHLSRALDACGCVLQELLLWLSITLYVGQQAYTDNVALGQTLWVSHHLMPVSCSHQWVSIICWSPTSDVLRKSKVHTSYVKKFVYCFFAFQIKEHLSNQIVPIIKSFLHLNSVFKKISSHKDESLGYWL